MAIRLDAGIYGFAIFMDIASPCGNTPFVPQASPRQKMKISLREKQTAARRTQMLDAAETLIRQSGSTEFSMRALASAAEVSPATPYNFFGSKEGLLFALLFRSLAHFLDEALVYSSNDPLENILEGADNATSILLSDPVLLRPLYQVMLGLSDSLHRPKFIKEAFIFYRALLLPAVEQQLLADEYEHFALASALMSHFMGVLDFWVHEDVVDEWFRAQIQYGFIRLIWPMAKGKSLKMLQARLEQVNTVLSNRRKKPSFY